jgi:HEAT repeat protein
MKLLDWLLRRRKQVALPGLPGRVSSEAKRRPSVDPLLSQKVLEQLQAYDVSGTVEMGTVAVEALIMALNHRDWLVRSRAAEALGEIGDKRAVDALVAVLRDEVEPVRLEGAKALRGIADDRVAQPLIDLLKNQRVTAWALVTPAFQAIGISAVKPLLTALKNCDPKVTEALVDGLTQIGAPAVPSLLAALKARDADIRRGAAEALGRIGDAPAIEPLSMTKPDVAQLQAQCDVPGLIEVLKHDSREVQRAAQLALQTIGLAAVEPLIAALNTTGPRSEFHKRVVKALGELRDPRAVEPLIAALNDGNYSAAEALGKLGDPRAVEPLIAALNDGNYSAAEALGKLGDPRAIDPLISALAKEINGAAEALGELGAISAVEPLIAAALHHRESQRQAAAVCTLARIGTARARQGILLAMKKNHDNNSRFAIAGGVARVGAASGQVFLEALNDTMTCEAALWAIGVELVDRDKGLPVDEPWQTNYRPIIGWLLDAIRNAEVKRGVDPYDIVTTRAIYALAAIGDSTCVPTLDALLTRVRGVGNVREYADIGHAKGYMSTNDAVRELETTINQIRARATAQPNNSLQVSAG